MKTKYIFLVSALMIAASSVLAPVTVTRHAAGIDAKTAVPQAMPSSSVSSSQPSPSSPVLSSQPSAAQKSAASSASSAASQAQPAQTPPQTTQAPPQPAAPANLVKTAYLTFDYGPSALTPKILDALDAKGVKATFFVVGKDYARSRGLLVRMVRGGHVVGIHSWTHKYNEIYSSESNFLADFNRLKSFITEVTGISPEISRFPGGVSNTVSLKYGGRIMPTLLDDVTRMGITPFDWNVSAADAEKTPPTRELVVQNVLSGCTMHNNAVILMHDMGRNTATLEALPEIIDRLTEQGFVFSTLSPSSPKVLAKPV